ncbi:MAG: cation:proton antiporter [Alphaproteobacteria bacterium]|nr:cation:proton antiporter [Alphaproteobacteria bacterium]
MIVSFALSVYRLLKGPSPADRVVALDMLALLGIGFIGLFSISTGEYAFLDVAIALALVGFLATVAFARYVYRGALAERRESPATEAGDES